MRVLLSIALAGAAAVTGLFPLSASAQPPRVPGYDCHVPGGANVWQTTFTGWREDVFGQREDILVSPCFASEADCEAWLYWAQTDWTHNFISHPRCRTWRG